MVFDYNDGKVKLLEKSISSDRLARYTLDIGEGQQERIEVYALNTALSESFYTPLQGVEVTLRNAIHGCLTQNYGENWFDDSLLTLQPIHRGMLSQANKAIIERRKIVTPGRMVAELNFGFWTGLLGPKYETELWRKNIRLAFPNRPAGTERKEVHSAINKIRRLRNRVAHHEPIMHRNLLEDHETIIRIIGWVCPETARWVNDQSRFSKVFSSI